MINKYIYMTFVVFISACSTPAKLDKFSLDNNVNFNQIEQIALGQTQEQVVKILGKPETKETIEISGKTIGRFEYTKADQSVSQRATIVFDASFKTVKAKTFIPTEGDLVNWLNYLISEKYKDLKFNYYLKPRCKDHSASTESIAVNLDQGILINYVKSDLGVLAISWMEQNELSDIVKNLELCQKGMDSPR